MGHDEVSIVDHSRYERGKRRRLCASLPEVVSDDEHKEASTQTDESFHNEASCQTDSGYINFLEGDNVALRSELQALKMNSSNEITDELFRDNEGIVKFYTGLPNWIVFNAVMTLISPCFSQMPNSKLSISQMQSCQVQMNHFSNFLC